MRHVGILGGTFDPVHNGHISMALEAKEALNLDIVYFLPAAMPPLKAQQPVARAEERYRMVQLAIEGSPIFDILDWEIGKRTTCYSVETARRLHGHWPSFKFYWIIGSDQLEMLSSWLCIGELVRLVDFVVISREGHPIKPPYIPNLNLHKVEGRTLGTNSTEIRQKVQDGDSIEGEVPTTVSNYISVKGIYK